MYKASSNGNSCNLWIQFTICCFDLPQNQIAPKKPLFSRTFHKLLFTIAWDECFASMRKLDEMSNGTHVPNCWAIVVVSAVRFESDLSYRIAMEANKLLMRFPLKSISLVWVVTVCHMHLYPPVCNNNRIMFYASKAGEIHPPLRIVHAHSCRKCWRNSCINRMPLIAIGRTRSHDPLLLMSSAGKSCWL